MHDNPKPLLVEGSDIYIMTTGDPVQDLKWIVHCLHNKDVPPVEVMGAMLCNIIDMLEGKAPDVIAHNVDYLPQMEARVPDLGDKVEPGEWQ